MPNIAIITSTFPPYHGGMGKVAELDANQLSGLGHRVTVFTPSRRTLGGVRSAAPYEVIEMNPLLRYGNAAFVPAAVAALRKFDVAMIHVPFFGAHELFALAAGSRRAKLIVNYHMDVVGGGPIVKLFSLPSRLLLPRLLRAADRVIVTSFDYARSSVIAPLVDADPSRFRELPPSVDVSRFSPGARADALLERYGLEQSDRIVLFVGGLDRPHYFKGLRVLLTALASKELRTARLLIVGEGELQGEYERFAVSLGVRGRVVFAGGAPDAEMPDHFRLADVFAFPSIDRSEAFGIAALEALACGVPVVASDLFGVRTIVRNGETGYVALPGSVSGVTARLRDLLDDPDRHALAARTARQVAATEYSDEVRTKKLARIIGELL